MPWTSARTFVMAAFTTSVARRTARSTMSRYAVVGASKEGEEDSVSIIPSYLERKAIEGTGNAERDVQTGLLLYLVKALEEQAALVDDTLGRELDRVADALELQNKLLAQIADRL